jgi:hypothetical protein
MAGKWWQSSASEEWYTPTEIIGVARRALGGIDLDPASCVLAQQTVGAASYFTRDDDGLTRPWHGRVWLNPPFGRPIASWTQKLRTEYVAGRVTQAIALVPARVDTRWYRELDDVVALTCHLNGRLKFIGATNSAPFPTALFYLGKNASKFRRVFGALPPGTSAAERGLIPP